VNLIGLRRHSISAVTELRKVLRNGSTVLPICLRGLPIEVIKQTLLSYASYATKCYQTFLCYLPNFVITYLHTYILTYAMKQSPSWEAKSFSASQDILSILRKPNVHYRIHSAHHVPLLNLAHTFDVCLTVHHSIDFYKLPT